MKGSGSWGVLLIASLLLMYAGAAGKSGEFLACFLAPRIVVVSDSVAPDSSPLPAPTLPPPDINKPGGGSGGGGGGFGG